MKKNLKVSIALILTCLIVIAITFFSYDKMESEEALVTFSDSVIFLDSSDFALPINIEPVTIVHDHKIIHGAKSLRFYIEYSNGKILIDDEILKDGDLFEKKYYYDDKLKAVLKTKVGVSLK